MMPVVSLFEQALEVLLQLLHALHLTDFVLSCAWADWLTG